MEVIFAIFVLAFGLLAVASMQSSAIRGNLFGAGKTEALTWGQDTIEGLMALPYNNADLNAGAHNDPNPPPNYTISWNVTDDSPTTNCKLIVVTITPQISGVGRPIQLTGVKPNL